MCRHFFWVRYAHLILNTDDTDIGLMIKVKSEEYIRINHCIIRAFVGVFTNKMHFC